MDERKRIVGGPCHPVEFCSDVGSTDPTVRDHCSDIWLDFDCEDPGMESDPRCIDGDRNPCYPDPTSPECITPTPTPTPADYCYLPGIGDWWDNPDCKDYLENKYKTIAPSSPSLSPPCPPDAKGNEVCPLSGELTPVPPTDEPSPVPEPSPECPDAGPEVCGEDTPPPDEEPPDSDTDADDGNGNDETDGDRDGEDGDGSNGDGGEDEGEI